ncbi:MAG TPA: HlyD family efflux transporter periplasmic adaptor subunit [Anaerolineae bacterium]|nr:HlyD family efflux transporter periplasmic adaptor subunit [Anaerolineae bacterium]HIQ06078.1 HlyD family efflux transporter periplasmic adaptor subunit [Anaerolineae bacterium]
MKRIVLVVAFLLLLVAGYYGYTVYTAPEPQAVSSEQIVPSATPQIEQELENVIWASGELQPGRRANLSFTIGGQLTALTVQEGDEVQAGRVLAKLDSNQLASNAAQADATLAAAQADLERLKAGARPQQLRAAQAAVDAATARLRQAQASLRAAQAGVDSAKAAVDTAQAQVAIAQAEYRRLKAGPKPEEIAAAKATMNLAAAAVRHAQEAYDRIRGNPHAATMPEALKLEQATIEHEAAKAQYEALVRGATTEELAVALAQVEAAKAAVKQAEVQVEIAQAQADAAQAEVDAAQAALAQAQAQLNLLQAGARKEELAAAEAAVEQAIAARRAALAALSEADLVAPFAGTVGTIWVKEGEVVAPGQPVMALGDLKTLRVETTDLRETDVTRVAIGQQVEVTFDSLPGEVFSGTITHLAPMATEEKGSTNYTAIVELDQLDPRLRWGMTAFVNITVK